MRGQALVAACCVVVTTGISSAAEHGVTNTPAFSERGYYMTFMRMPTHGLPAWKETIDCVHEDGGNLIILWMAGGFRSEKFPETWAYNRDHANVKRDFVAELIDYAHSRRIRVLLGFTPFGYDGVNQMPLKHPEWRATGPDGKPTRAFGIHCWGYNLCPANPDTQAFMLEYVREMYFDSYPNADGLFIESSDYAICHCMDCGSRFFEHEFRFVKAISEDIWEENKDNTVVIYPHYFSGARVPGLNVTAAKQPFDSRWTLFFTPHSALPNAELIGKARASIWWDDAPALHTPQAVREGARRAKDAACSGYIPSLEAFSFVATNPEEGQHYLIGKRQVPFGFGWLQDGEMPYCELPVRVNRIAYREYTRNPELTEAEFRDVLGKELFGKAATQEALQDALTLQDAFMSERSWCQAAPLASPNRVQSLREAGQLTLAKRAEYQAKLNRVREIEAEYRSRGEPFVELHRIARWLGEQWAGEHEKLLAP